MKEPKFWYDTTHSLSFFAKGILWIFSRVFLLGAWLKSAVTRTQAISKPVICIGNLTVGGAGKTPTTLSIAHYLQEQGQRVAIISRGYKGRLKGPLKVDPTHHSAIDVGDEALLMAHACPTWISANRFKGAKAALQEGADMILLDDGLQNITLKQDLKLCVLNAKQKFGNQKVMPLGPLRETLCTGIQRVDAFIMISNTDDRSLTKPPITTEQPFLQAHITVNPDDLGLLKNRKLIAFAGLAHPEKFFETLRHEQLDLHQTLSFQDHYAYTHADLEALVKTAQEHNATLVTTEKDWMRLPHAFQDKILQLRITIQYENPALLNSLLEPLLKGNSQK